MVRKVASAKQDIEDRRKVKTGCTTCRVRRIKCDEGKPSCQKCVSTGRACDGFESPFRLVNCGMTQNSHEKVSLIPHLDEYHFDEIATEDVEFLNRCLSTKTISSGVKLDCRGEVRQILCASSTDPSVRNALLSLKALRNDLETAGEGLPFVTPQDPGYTLATQQYSMALEDAASNLTSTDVQRVRSALLCCQLFISIEQLRANYYAMTQHIVGGLQILYEYRTRQILIKSNQGLTEADHLPQLDVFIVKVFAAPCRFSEPPAQDLENKNTIQAYPIAHPQWQSSPRYLRTLAPNTRIELVKIAAQILEFLYKISTTGLSGNIVILLSEKANLLYSLDSWLASFELLETESMYSGLKPISTLFMRLFHQVLKVVLVGQLASECDLHVQLQKETNQLLTIAGLVSEKVHQSERNVYAVI